MSKNFISNEAISNLSQNHNITFISSKQINFTPDFKRNIAHCKSINEVRTLLIANDIKLYYLGEKRISSLYTRLRNQYKQLGDAAFVSEKRGRKNKLALENKTYQEASAIDKLSIAEEIILKQQEEIDMLKKFMPFLQKNFKKGNKFNAIFNFTQNNGYRNLSTTKVIALLCDYLDVSVSGYYKHLKIDKSSSALIKQNMELEIEIFRIQNMKFRKSKSKFKRIGYRQMTMQLNRIFNFPINHKRVIRIMKKLGLQSTFRKKNNYNNMPIKDVDHKEFENILDRNFDSPYPGMVICTDITYLKHANKTSYLSVMKDATTGKILSHEISDKLKVDFVLETVEGLPFDLLHDETIIQSDQGFHYTCSKYVKLLQKYGIHQSMSRKGKCIDNAPVESFFGHLKDEVAYEDCKSLSQVTYIINEYVDYYNFNRPQFHKKKMTPHEYEMHLYN